MTNLDDIWPRGCRIEEGVVLAGSNQVSKSKSFTHKVNCFTGKGNCFKCKVNCFARKDKCFTLKTLDKGSFWPRTTNYAYKYDKVLRVKHLILPVKHLTLGVKQSLIPLMSYHTRRHVIHVIHVIHDLRRRAIKR